MSQRQPKQNSNHLGWCLEWPTCRAEKSRSTSAQSQKPIVCCREDSSTTLPPLMKISSQPNCQSPLVTELWISCLMKEPFHGITDWLVGYKRHLHRFYSRDCNKRGNELFKITAWFLEHFSLFFFLLPLRGGVWQSVVTLQLNWKQVNNLKKKKEKGILT